MKKQKISIFVQKFDEQGKMVKTFDEVDAFVEGDYAVHKDYLDGKTWRVTYLPVGFYLPTPRMKEIKTKKQAVEIIKIWLEAFPSGIPIEDNNNEWSKEFMPKKIAFPSRQVSDKIQEQVKLVLTK